MDRMDFPINLEKRCELMTKKFKDHALSLILNDDSFSEQWDEYEGDTSVETSIEIRLAYCQEQAHIARAEIAPRFRNFAQAVENLAYETMSGLMRTLHQTIEKDSGGWLRAVVIVTSVPNPDYVPTATLARAEDVKPPEPPPRPHKWELSRNDKELFLSKLGIAFD